MRITNQQLEAIRTLTHLADRLASTTEQADCEERHTCADGTEHYCIGRHEYDTLDEGDLTNLHHAARAVQLILDQAPVLLGQIEAGELEDELASQLLKEFMAEAR